ncbi:hypothetical protein ES705_49784 [subsurface metagenome]
MIFSLIIDGFAVGSVYALVAVGLVMLVRATGALNFAHGDIMMFSTFVAYSLLVQLELPFWAALSGSLLFAACLGMVIERLVIRRLMKGSMAGIIMGTLGIAYILQGVAKMIWTDDIFKFPEFFPGDFINRGGHPLSLRSLFLRRVPDLPAYGYVHNDNSHPGFECAYRLCRTIFLWSARFHGFRRLPGGYSGNKAPLDAIDQAHMLAEGSAYKLRKCRDKDASKNRSQYTSYATYH